MLEACRLGKAAASALSGVLLAVIFLGCGASRSTESYSTQPGGSSATAATPAVQAPEAQAQNSPSPQQPDFAGVWQGTTLANCGGNSPLPSRCNALQNVTITLIEGPKSNLTGKYSCAYGNMDCYHANETGKVIGVSLTGARINIRIIMPDATSCIFTGRNVNQTIDGGYTCYQGGSLIEQGSWRARRSY